MKLFSSKSSRAPKVKSGAFIIALVLILVMAIGGTVAFLVTQTDQVINTFTPTNADITVTEEVSGNLKTSIQVKNNSLGVTAYVRVALVANMIDDDGNVTDGAAVPDFTLNSDKWILGSDGYYYYKTPVAAESTTENLLADGSSMKLDNGLQVVILADAIQAEPTTAVTEAWGVTVNSDGTLAK